jgi:hypothetical protein
MSVAESKTKALLDQGFAQTGVMLRKEDKACIVTDMGRVEWFQVNPWGGVQALSAAPAIGDELRDTLVAVSAAIAERDDRAAQKMICEILAASTTPPAEQQAQPGAVYAELPQPDSWHHFTAQFWENKLRDFADRTHALRMQAAHKAAQGEQNTVPASWLEQAYREGWAACRDAETIGGEAEDWAFGNSTANSRMIDAQQAAPKQEAQEPTEIPEEIERMAADRYKVVPSHESMFHRWAVVAGSGTQQLYLGREVECQNMARKFAGAFLDGAFFAMQQPAPQQEAQDATVAAFEAVRKKLCTLPRYSFVLDDDGLVRRAPDRTGNWIEFDEAHALFDPLSVDAAIAAQGGKA